MSLKIISLLALAVLILFSSCTQANATITAISPTEEIPTATATATTTATTVATATVAPTTTPTPVEYEYLQGIGVNMAGGEFGTVVPGTMGVDYIYPDCTVITRWVGQGVTVFRYAFLLERVVENGQPRTEDLQKITEAMDCASSLNAYLILDMHNYMRVNIQGKEHLIGSKEYPLSRWIDAWSLLSEKYAKHQGLGGYSLMGEPHDLGEISWLESAQKAINAIRVHDMQTPIFVEGDCWASSNGWRQCNEQLNLVQDPANALFFETHVFFDPDGTGGYVGCATPVDCNATMENVVSFVEWCTEKQVNCFVGSLGVPWEETLWEPFLITAFDYLRDRHIGISLWAAGPWWGDYKLSLEKENTAWVVELLKDY